MSAIPKYSQKLFDKYEKKGREAEKKNPYFRFVCVNPYNVSIKTGNCGVRAIAYAENVPYERAEDELLGCLSRIGFGNYCYIFDVYLDEEKERITMKKAGRGESRMTGKRFAEEHPEGRYVLKMAGHLTACVDGKICDTWDCSGKAVYVAWKC